MAPQKFAEYQDPAPEVNARSRARGSSDLEYVSGPHPSVGGEHRKKVFGLAPRMIFALICIMLIVIVAIVVGTIFGTRHANHCGKLAYHTNEHFLDPAYLYCIVATAINTPSPTGSGIAAATPSALSIIQAVYDASDVTDKARPVIQKGPYIILDMNNTGSWGVSDPGSTQCLALLHSNGATMRTFVACDGDGPFTLVPEYAIPSSHTQDTMPQGRNSSNFSIVSVVWGAQEIRDEAVYDALYDYKANGSTMLFGNELFRNDSLYGISKCGVIWYTEDDFRTIKSKFAMEGKSISF